MEFREGLRRALYAGIEDAVKINRPLGFWQDFRKKNGAVVRALYEQGVVSDMDIEIALKRGVVARAQRDYEKVVRSGARNYNQWEHIIKEPEFLAFALHAGEFSMMDLKPLFTSDTEQKSFMASTLRPGPGLLARLRGELLTPVEDLALTSIGSGTECFECGH
ncbi:hypothetical protein J4233_00555 [Candidatus Pacearchaeota archaeon]|nr:hypothetical protein [Candidatus Pacearchaeota archaeon]